jgi:hypothetical protein
MVSINSVVNGSEIRVERVDMLVQRPSVHPPWKM